jgi:hypothetical protein
VSAAIRTTINGTTSSSVSNMFSEKFLGLNDDLTRIRLTSQSNLHNILHLFQTKNFGISTTNLNNTKDPNFQITSLFFWNIISYFFKIQLAFSFIQVFRKL